MTKEEKNPPAEEKNKDLDPVVEEKTKNLTDSEIKSEEIKKEIQPEQEIETDKSSSEEEVAEKENENAEPVVEEPVKLNETSIVEEEVNTSSTDVVEDNETDVKVVSEPEADNKPEIVEDKIDSDDPAKAEIVEKEIDKESLPKPVKDKEDDFGWENISKVADVYTKEERTELEALYDETLSTISESEVVDGTVVFITKREVVINIGYKSEAVISLNEFRYNPEMKIGDKVEVYVETQEDKHGQLILSHKKARALRSWDRVNEAFEKNEIIKGYIKCRTKGGMIVDVFGIEAFLPGSQIDVKPIRDYDIYVSKTMEFKIVKINHEFKNVVVSHKALIEAELEVQRQEIILKLEKGQVLEGTVKNITSYGVFIDLGGVDGLIHITDLSWGRVSHPEEIVELDQKINVVILDFDDAKKRIALGLKQLTKHPWYYHPVPHRSFLSHRRFRMNRLQFH